MASWQGVFHYTWWAPQMSFHQVVNLCLEYMVMDLQCYYFHRWHLHIIDAETSPNLWCKVCHSMSNIVSPWELILFGALPNVVKHFPDPQLTDVHFLSIAQQGLSQWEKTIETGFLILGDQVLFTCDQVQQDPLTIGSEPMCRWPVASFTKEVNPRLAKHFLSKRGHR